MSDTLLARRQALDAALAAGAAQVDALEAKARLSLDARHVWALDEEEAKHASHAAADDVNRCAHGLGPTP